jgi:outer membrane protein OmpA-like peptidoglycan-associated protein
MALQDALDYNRDLSLRRAKAVVAALVSRFKIKSKRLSAEGVGFLAPVANNQDDKGKALNRRVELIAR